MSEKLTPVECPIIYMARPGEQFQGTAAIPGAGSDTDNPQLFNVGGTRRQATNTNAPCKYNRMYQMVERGMDPTQLGCEQCGAQFTKGTPRSLRKNPQA